MVADVEQMLRAGNVDAAIQAMQDHLRRQPDDVQVLMQLASVAANMGAVPVALSALRKVVQVAPQHGYAWFGIADLEAGRGNLAEADAAYRRAGYFLPSEAAIAYNHGVLLERMGKPDEAIEAFREAVVRRNDFAPAHNNLGTLLLGRGESDLAARHFSAALRADPSLLEARFNLGLIAETSCDRATAESRFREVLERDAMHRGAIVGLARVLTDGDTAQRLEALRLCDQAIAIAPQDPSGHHARGVVLDRQRKFVEAAQSFLEAWHISGASMHDALSGLGLALHKANKNREALAAFNELAALRPLNPSELLTVIHLRLTFCEWETLAQDVKALGAAIERGQCVDHMFPGLSLCIPGLDEGHLHKISTRFASRLADLAPVVPAPEMAPGTMGQARPLRIGYLSADLREHAVSHVLAGVLEHHDPKRVEVFAYSNAPVKDSPMRERLLKAFAERFRDIGDVDEVAAAEMIQADGIDILVDLTGWTANSRHDVLLLNPAPIKVNWLGFPGSMGNRAFADYLIGDAITTPESSAHNFSETLALMPHSYMPTDNRRVRGPRPSRREAGLPESGVVFCCFNQPYKITPDVFDVWCRLLRELPDSVLWLVAHSQDAQANLRREASARGVDQARLIFAPFAPTTEEHLGRLQLADVALDTAPYNSHSTAVDALWCGVPLVCVRGQRFTERVAASVVTAAGVPELCVATLDDYYRLAMTLASDALARTAMKSRLDDARSRSALFDTQGFTRDLETLYQRIWEHHRTGRQDIVRLLDA